MADSKYTPRLKRDYDERIAQAMVDKFGYKNRLEVPKLEKIVLNMGVGEATQDKKKVETAASEMELIAGQKPVVTKAMPKDGKVIVSGVNVAARHRKPSQANPQGGIERREAPLHVSKVALEDPKTGKATRVRFEERDGKKVRVAVRSGELING